jgi:hypothetical protein
MNDNGLPNDPLMAAQFGVPTLTRVSVLQNVDRTNGEFFPAIAGDFFHVDSVDFPARISFGNTDPEQSVPLIPGMEVRGRFSGITIYHDNYSSALFRPKIQFNLGRGNVLAINNSLGRNGISLPAINSSTGASVNTSLMVPYGFHLLDAVLYNKVTNAAAPEIMQVFGRFRDLTNNTIVPPTVARNGVTFNAPTGFHDTALTEWRQLGPANSWACVVKFRDLPIPTGAETFQIIYVFNTPPTSNDTVTVAGFAR